MIEYKVLEHGFLANTMSEFFVVENPVECNDFTHIVGTTAILQGRKYYVNKVERFMHAAPWYAGERIALHVTEI